MSFFTNPIATIKGMWNGQRPAGQPAAAPSTPDVPQTTQLLFSDAETRALRRHIETCESSARDGMTVLKERFADQERKWREKVGLQGGEEGKSNFRVQLILALCFSKHAREVEALFGTKAAIKATPRGPTDTKVAERTSLFLTWQVYENMQALKAIALWMLRRLKHGRSFMFCPWERRSYSRTVGGKTERVVYREGPVPYPMGNDDWIAPVSIEGKAGFDSVQTAEWFIRRYFTTPTEMLMKDNEPGGDQNPEGDWYQGIKRNWRKIVSYAKSGIIRDSERDTTAIEVDYAEGVIRDGMNVGTGQGQVEVWEWYGKWRRWVDVETGNEIENAPVDETSDDFMSNEAPPPGADIGGAYDDAGLGADGGDLLSGSPAQQANGSVMGATTEGTEYREQGDEAADLAYSGPDPDSGETFDDGTFIDSDGVRKQMVEMDVLVRYCPRLNLIVGIQDLSELYPDTPNKRPILEMSLCNDGQYWSMGLIELSEEIEHEMTVLANLAIQGTAMSMAPPIFADPSIGEGAFSRKYEPGDVIWTTNPQGVKQLDIRPNVEVLPMMWNLFQSLYERLTGLTDLSMGRGMDQPNAPRTLGGQRLVMGAGDVRLALDMKMLAEDLKPFLQHVWDCSRMFGSEEQFFRVAEGSSLGQFEPDEVNGGFARLGAKERAANFDFTLEFADDMQVREGKKQEWLALLPLIVSFPRVQTDLVMQHRFLGAALEAFGKSISDFGDEPPPLMTPRLPELEWTMALEGQDINVHPQDDDAMHIADHESRIMAMVGGKPEDRDEDAMLKMWDHIQQHTEQMQMKQMAAAVAGTMAEMSGAAQVGAQGGQQDPMAMLMQSMQGGQNPNAQGGRGATNGTAMGGTSNVPAGQQPAPTAPTGGQG
jgi:hypothetical protein